MPGKGHVTARCIPVLAARFMPLLMREFPRLHQAISLHLAEGDHEQLMRDLGQGRIEMAITFAGQIPTAFETKLLFGTASFCVAARGSPARGRQRCVPGRS